MADNRANGMDAISKSYVDLKLSRNMVELIINSWSKGTKKQYSSPRIDRWFGYCTRQNVDPFESSLNQSAEFLVEYLHERVSNSFSQKVMVNNIISALSHRAGGINLNLVGRRQNQN